MTTPFLESKAAKYIHATIVLLIALAAVVIGGYPLWLLLSY